MAKKKKSATRQEYSRVKDPDFTIYTDGGCAVNPGGPGGIGVLVINNRTNEVREIYRGYNATTNNRMEITAIIEGIAAIPEGSTAMVHSDSQYVIYCMEGMWRKKKNVDLWEKLDEAMNGKRIGTVWVKGHNGNTYNERCDTLATMAMELPGKIDDTGYLLQKEAGREFYEKVDEHEKKATGGAMSVEIVIPGELNDHEPEAVSAGAYVKKYDVKDSCARAIRDFYLYGDKSFKSYIPLKTGGIDAHSRKTAEEIAESSTDAGVYLGTLRKYLSDEKDVNAAARWNARGLSIKDSIRKVLVDNEIRQKISRS